MFGYIKPYKPEMKFKEYALFRAYYCGICKRLGKFSQFARPMLTYDCTLFALIYDSVKGIHPKITQKACVLNPVKKKPEADSEGIVMAAALNLLWGYYKLKDDSDDEKNLLSKSGAAALKSAYKKALAEYPALDGIIAYSTTELKKAESSMEISIDAVAHCFASMLQKICAHLFDNEALSWFGYNVGRYIYIADAYNDMLKDYKQNVYNPFVLRYGTELINNKDVKAECRDSVHFLLNGCMKEIVRVFAVIELKTCEPIIENIILEGMPRKITALIEEEREERDGPLRCIRRQRERE